MKTKLLLTTILASTLGFSQQPINNFFSTPGSQFAIVAQTVNQTASGASAVWSFGTLTQTGTNNDAFAAPTAGELASFPGSTQVLTISDGTSNDKLFYEINGMALSLTGANNSNYNIDYNTDNALVGTYPLAFGNASTTDAIAGTITAQGQTTAYTGTITNAVDAYGTLSFNIAGQGSYSGSVTRVKTEQNISFNVTIPPFPAPFPATGVLTSYNYYKDTDGVLVFRTTSGVISVNNTPVQSFDSTEALITNTLSTESNLLAVNDIKLYPNPAETILSIDMNTNFIIQSIRINDLNGRTVFETQENTRNINIEQLTSGLYVITVNTNAGSITKKIIKK